MKLVKLDGIIEDSKNEFKKEIDIEKCIKSIISMSNSSVKNEKIRLWLFINNDGQYDADFIVNQKENDQQLRELSQRLDNYNLGYQIINKTNYIIIEVISSDTILKFNDQYFVRKYSSNKLVNHNNPLEWNDLLTLKNNLVVYKWYGRYDKKEKFNEFNFTKFRKYIPSEKDPYKLNEYGLYDQKYFLTISGYMFKDNEHFFDFKLNNKESQKMEIYELLNIFENQKQKWYENQILINSFQRNKINRFNENNILDEVLRELLINAIVHRDYNIEAPIEVEFGKNYFKISNPLVANVESRTNNIYNLLKMKKKPIHCDYEDNLLIYNTFKKINFIERENKGFDTFEKMKQMFPQIDFIFDFSINRKITITLKLIKEDTKLRKNQFKLFLNKTGVNNE